MKTEHKLLLVIVLLVLAVVILKFNKNDVMEVYSSRGKIEEFTIEPNQYGTRWDVFELRNGQIIEITDDNMIW